MLCMSLAQLLAGDGIVIDLVRPPGGRLVDIPTQPDRLHDDADLLVMLTEGQPYTLENTFLNVLISQRLHQPYLPLKNLLEAFPAFVCQINWN
jgi:hypothetical protein